MIDADIVKFGRGRATGARPLSVRAMSGVGLDGTTFTDQELLDRVETDGALLIVRGPAERLRANTWGTELRSAATARGMQLAIRDLGEVMLICDLHRTHPSMGVADDAAGRRPDGPAASGPRPDAWVDHPSRGARLRLIRGGLLDPGDDATDDPDTTRSMSRTPRRTSRAPAQPEA